MTPSTFSIADIEKMRAIIHQHDKTNQGGSKEFDLAKPPVPPYRYQRYDLLMYNHDEGTTAVARDAAQEAKLAEQGFACEPFEIEAPTAHLSAADRREIEAVEKNIELPKRARKVAVEV